MKSPAMMRYRLVPAEATEAIDDAIHRACVIDEDIYQAMLAAAPEPDWEALAEAVTLAFFGLEPGDWAGIEKADMAAALREVLGG